MEDIFDFVVISGCPINISGKEDVLEQKKLISSGKKPIFGICLGLQIISIVFGSKLSSLDLRKQGFFDYEFEGVIGRMNYNNGFCIIDEPKSFVVVKRVDGFVDLMINESAKIVAVQGYPERSGVIGKTIFRWFLKKFLD